VEDSSSEHFRQFAKSLESRISWYEDENSENAVIVIDLQKDRVERLVALEDRWRLAVIQSKNGEKVYQAFVSLIRDVRRNVLTARPFFRERQPVFTRSISKALKKRNWRKLYKFRINWSFISFAMKAAKWRRGGVVEKLAEEIAALRNELVEVNLPLAISRSRIFWSRTPKSHISFMDFTSIATEGLISAVDKFELPYKPVFASVAIGRMTGNFIEDYSQTMLHFFPSDRRKIYRANKFLSRHSKGEFEIKDLVAAVNKDSTKSQRTTEHEIAELIAAASTVSADTKAPGDNSEDVPDNVARYEAPEDWRPDVRFEKNERMQALYSAVEKLPLIDRKLLKLLGVYTPSTV
jgi:DNA-directed RNA polymerase specialized sigma subunit